VDRGNHFDTFEVQVELPALVSDTMRDLNKKQKEVQEALNSLLGVKAKVTLLEPNSLERSLGKAVRVQDRRKLHD
jgi:phenylacetate-CoA ligase